MFLGKERHDVRYQYGLESSNQVEEQQKNTTGLKTEPGCRVANMARLKRFGLKTRYD